MRRVLASVLAVLFVGSLLWLSTSGAAPRALREGRAPQPAVSFDVAAPLPSGVPLTGCDASDPAAPVTAAEPAVARSTERPEAPGVDRAPERSLASEPVPWRARLTVELVLPADAGDVGLPVPELLRIDANGGERSVDPPARVAGHPALGLARRAAAGEPLRTTDVARRTFVLEEPGRYVVAWHAWRRVPDTRTWRAVRGRGEALELRRSGEARQVVLPLGPADLALDPLLDATPVDPHWHVTEKDG